jgi:hypothetical protein
VDYENEDMIVFTTIPARYIGKPDDPDGHSEWMVRAPTKRKVLTAPGYPKPTPKPRMNLCIVKETPNMGLGLFATADISPDELVVSERPLFVYPKGLALSDKWDQNKYSQNDLMKIAMHEQERKLEYAVSRMNDDDQKAFKSLVNNHTEDGSGPLLGICRTNGYGINLHDGLVKSNTNSYGAFGKLGSRINHR